MGDSTSFISFLGFPDQFPDSRTIWLFRERMVRQKRTRLYGQSFKDSWTLWVYRLDAERFKMLHLSNQTGVLLKKPRCDAAKTRRSRDGTIAKKGIEYHFGYKLHQITDIDYYRSLE